VAEFGDICIAQIEPKAERFFAVCRKQEDDEDISNIVSPYLTQHHHPY
jgi:hypothetical protein